jgi:two-component system KDP operon response regulator KdpE
MKEATILVVDDEPRLVRLVRANLERAGYRVLTAATAPEALDEVAADSPDAVILDLMLPGMDGFDLCARIREFSPVPILMLTAKAEQGDKVHGLDLGADDYVTKPFDPAELLARLRAVLRRSGVGEEPRGPPIFRCGDLSIDFARRRVTVGAREVRLARTEYKLLYHLATNAGRVMLHEELLRRVWGEAYREETDYLWVYVRYLRQKIEDDPSRPRYLHSEPGIGYVLRCRGERLDAPSAR